METGRNSEGRLPPLCAAPRCFNFQSPGFSSCRRRHCAPFENHLQTLLTDCSRAGRVAFVSRMTQHRATQRHVLSLFLSGFLSVTLSRSSARAREPPVFFLFFLLFLFLEREEQWPRARNQGLYSLCGQSFSALLLASFCFRDRGSRSEERIQLLPVRGAIIRRVLCLRRKVIIRSVLLVLHSHSDLTVQITTS